MKYTLAAFAALFFSLRLQAQVEAMQQKVDIATQFIVYLEKGKLKKAFRMIQPDTLRKYPQMKDSIRIAAAEMKAAMKTGAGLFISVTPNEEFTRFICQCQYQLKGNVPENIYQVDVIYNYAQNEDISKVRFFDRLKLETLYRKEQADSTAR